MFTGKDETGRGGEAKTHLQRFDGIAGRNLGNSGVSINGLNKDLHFCKRKRKGKGERRYSVRRI